MKYSYNKIGLYSSFLFIAILIAAISLVRSGVVDFERSAAAGFGIAPPFINGFALQPGSQFTDKITLLRNETGTDQFVSLHLDDPALASWLKFYPGSEFVFAKGEERMAFQVEVTVPTSTLPGAYAGKLFVVMAAATSTGQVAIGLGAQVDINLDVATSTGKLINLAK